jgi:CRISPR system Cascade subunit CasB
MEQEKKEKTSRGRSFVEYALQRMKDDSGFGAALRRADNPATEYQAWEHLASWCDLEKSWERVPFATVAAALARAKPVRNGHQPIGQALAACYDEGNQSDNAKSKLRRLLACDTVEEACRVLRPLLGLMASKEKSHLDYGSLLDDLLKFGEWTKQRWAMDFFGRRGDDDRLGV